MFLDPKNQNEDTETGVPGPQKPERGYGSRCSWTPKTGTRVQEAERRYKNRNEGTFAKTALLQNCPFTKPLYIYIYSKSLRRTIPKLLPRESFKVIFNLAGYFYFAKLFLETHRE